MSVVAEVRMQLPQPEDRHHAFAKGHPKFGGRKAGTRNKVGADVRQDIYDGLNDVGFVEKTEDGKLVIGKDGIRGFVRWLGIYEPKVAAALLARIMPFFIEVPPPPEIMTRSEIEAQLKELGLPLGLIDYFQKAPVRLDPDEDPDRRAA